jgi:ATP synthase protein I
MAEHRPTGDEKPSGRPPKRSSATSGDSGNWHQMAGIGVEFVAAIGVFTAIGWYADQKLGTAPWLLITGCGLGFTGGLWNMIKAAQRMMR